MDSVTTATAASAPSRPNLLIIQTDEHNFRTLGCYRALLPADQAFIWGEGIKVDTPHLDWIAAHGAIADRFYATSPVCTPSRAALLTGRYPQNTGAIQNDLPLRDDLITYAEVLRRVGYATGYAGKWHLDGDARPGFAPARKFGWEENRYMFNRGHYKKLIEDEKGPRVGSVNAQGVPTYAVDGADAKTFTTDFLTDRTIDFIRRHAAAPFCWHVSFPDPHGPNTVRAPYDTMFFNLDFKQPRSAQSPGKDLPAYAATLAGAFNKNQMALYFGMVKCLDDNVGRILATLRETGQLERTFIVVTSDHGDLCGEQDRGQSPLRDRRAVSLGPRPGQGLTALTAEAATGDRRHATRRAHGRGGRRPALLAELRRVRNVGGALSATRHVVTSQVSFNPCAQRETASTSA